MPEHADEAGDRKKTAGLCDTPDTKDWFITKNSYTLFEVKKYESLQYVSLLAHYIYPKTKHIHV